MLDANDSFSRITGFTANDAIGKTSFELGLWNDVNDRSKLEATIRRHGEINIFEAYFNTKAGGKVYDMQIFAVSKALTGEQTIDQVVAEITRQTLDLTTKFDKKYKIREEK